MDNDVTSSQVSYPKKFMAVRRIKGFNEIKALGKILRSKLLFIIMNTVDLQF